MIQILGLLGTYFDAVVVKVKTFLLLIRLAMAILEKVICQIRSVVIVIEDIFSKSQKEQHFKILFLTIFYLFYKR